MSRFAHSDESLLLDILASARRNNERDRITGMLLFCNGRFLQILEGTQEAVSRTFDRIRNDTRHMGVFKLDELVVPERQFGSWAMGFGNLPDAALAESVELGALFETRNDTIAHLVRPGVAYKILKSFSDGSMPLI